ncbi:hypothetical protein [Candidatus Solirubrobacter pratensis]|uniref:hypothetical protein n=1 Tax=Candidatus Solirubrobacter pratensis TaxID=1298857 RepID=UPI0004140024|nr:hypothetical protein [Candidatus Solirubrobacter pratensis]
MSGAEGPRFIGAVELKAAIEHVAIVGRNPARAADEVTVFKSVGPALEDLAIAAAVARAVG